MGKKLFNRLLVKILLWLTNRGNVIVFVEFINKNEHIHKTVKKLKHLPRLGATMFFDTDKEYMVARYVHKLNVGHKIYVILEPTNRISTLDDKNVK